MTDEPVDVGCVAELESARRLLLEPGTDADRLYHLWFHRQTGQVEAWPSPAAYRSAMLDAARLEPGWRVVRVAEGLAGAVVAMRGGRERLVAPPEMAPADPNGVAPGPGAALLVHPLVSGEYGGFWHLWSVGWQKLAPERLQRLYLCVARHRAPELALRVAALAPAWPAWSLKVLCGLHESGRRDRALLYLPADTELGSTWVAALLAAVRDLCDDETPPFVRRLMPGVGYAPDPSGGRSYGQALCEAVASAASLAGDPDRFVPAALGAIRAIAGTKRVATSVGDGAGEV